MWSREDSDKRQRQAIAAFAKRSGLEFVEEFTDAAVSGADHIEIRPGFTASRSAASIASMLS